MGKLKIRVLGTLLIEDEGNRTFSLTRKNKAVLAALALAGPAGLPRQKLVDLFWRDRSEKQARASLRQALVVIRKGLGPYQDCLQADPDKIVIDGAMVEVDAHEFDTLASSKSGADMDRALTLYKGDLLDDIRLNEESFEAWLQPLRERLRAKAIALLGEGLESTCDAAQCVVLASHLLELDPTDEAAHRALMRTYAAQGRDNAALKQFATCRDRLDRDLGIGPSRQTIGLYEEINGKRHRPTMREANGGERKMTDASKEPPDKASIAVLPFDNLSGDPDQEYFADGITEDIITLLSKQRWLFVIARNSSFTFRGATIDVRQVGQNLGVRYVLEGSVRKDGNRIRVTAQKTTVHSC